MMAADATKVVKVVVGTTNAAKKEAVSRVVDRIFPNSTHELIAIAVTSGVSDQPFSLAETMQGAKLRARACMLERPDADFWVGLEGGLELIEERYFECGWICVVNREGREGWGSSARLELSPKLVSMLKEGKELAVVIDEISGMTDVRSNLGAMGVITNGNLTRTEAYSHGVWFAFAPFISPQKYWL